MINLINETLIHPHINTKWTVVNCDKGMLECVSEDSVKVEYITKEFGLEMYAEQQKQRADELENILTHIKSHLNDLWYNGDASEHEYAINTLKYINSLEDNND
ncbi:hypothetical protein [Macrococcus armenti]|uniref:hypothetical protein n=1 Tax=Macrococcus armenti TaxID=2875764 RepID=UPI001CD703FD|nr:hypothetical protein [Macrococcus armenti]UBH10094.1 hypothetical protein LAU38_07350 [Macrococcus armenti]